MVLASLALSLVSAAGASLGSADTTLFWASGPVAPNETLLVAGARFPSSPIVVHLRCAGNKPSAPVVITPAKVSAASVVFTLPATVDPGAYTVQVCDGGGGGAAGEGAPAGCSNALPVNHAELWWAAGDAGNRSTSGGWVRLFGTGLDFAGHASEAGGQGEAAALEERLQHALRSRDIGGIESLARELSVLLGGRSGLAAGARGAAELQLQLLTSEGQAAAAAPVVIPALNGSMWDATYRLPVSLAPGVYSISARNQYQANWTPLDAFGGQHNPHSRTIEVLAAPARGKIFAVADYMQQCGVPSGGLNFTTGAPIVSALFNGIP